MTLHDRLKWMDHRPAAGAGSSSGFGKGIEPRNLRLCQHGATHVSLAGNWAGLAQSLHDLGEVLATTLNRAALLTQEGRFPRFTVCPSGRFAMNGCGGLGFDFIEWRRVWATRQPRSKGARCSLTVVGHDDAAAHHVLLTGAVDESRFAALARHFQGEPAASPPVSARGGHGCAGYHERFQCRKREYVEAPENGARPISVSAIPGLFESVLAGGIRISTTIVSAPIVQSSLWSPVAMRRNEDHLTMTAGRTQLRLQLDSVTEAWMVPLPEESGGGVAMELYDDGDRLLLGVGAGPGQEGFWREAISPVFTR